MKKTLLATAALALVALSAPALADTDITARNDGNVTVDANMNDITLDGGRLNSGNIGATGSMTSATFTAVVNNPQVLGGVGQEIQTALESLTMKSTNTGKVDLAGTMRDAKIKGGTANGLGVSAMGSGAGIAVTIIQR